MSSGRQFPIMGYVRGHQRSEQFTVPWAFLAPHEAQAKLNHHQDLDSLARRGGLDPAEALDILQGNPFATCRLSWEEATTQVKALLQAWAARQERASA